MNRIQIRCFLETAKCLNFSKAAANLFISQPTLSRNISMLEKELGIKLFSRNSFQGTSLTPAGSCMLDAFKESDKLIEDAIRRAHNIAQSESHTLSLGLLEGQMMDEKLGSILSEFSKEYPNIKLEMTKESFGELSRKLESDDYDIIITIDAEVKNNKNIKIKPLYTLPTYLAVPTSIYKKIPKKDNYSLKDFKDCNFICTVKNDAPAIANMLTTVCNKCGFEPKIKFACNLQEEAAMLEMGSGIAGLNSYHSIFHSPNIKSINVKEFEAQVFSICWKQAAPNPAVNLFSRFYNNFCKNS